MLLRRRIRQQEQLRGNPLLGAKNPYLLAKEKDYATAPGGAPRGGKHRGYGEYACIWDSQYPMRLQAGAHGTGEGIYPSPPPMGGYRPSFSPEQSRYSDSGGGGGGGADYGQRVEHIYESPKFVRNNSVNSHGSGDLPVYFEVDPPELPPQNPPSVHGQCRVPLGRKT